MSNLNLPPEALTHLLQLTLQDRVTGALIGSALGDTIGLYTEFLSSSVAAKAYPSRRFTLTGPTGPTPFHLDFHRAPKDPGHWTDDTDHALLILLAFLHGADTRKPTPPKLPSQHDLATRLRIWARQGFPPLQTMPLGLGRLVGSVLSSSNFISDPEGRAREAWERTGRHAAPNGSLMRTHVLGLICAFGGDGPEDGGEGDGLSKAEREMFSAAASLSRVTHVDPRCVLSCVIGTTLVRGVVRGEVRSEEDIDAVISRSLLWFRTEGKVEADGDVDEAELWRHVKPQNGLNDLGLDDTTAMGYVYKTLGAGVMILRMALRREKKPGSGLWDKSKAFEELITDLVMRGGDADTNACFAGALLGAHLGYGALPDHWKHGLKHEVWLLSIAQGLCRVLGVMDGEYIGTDNIDTDPYAGREPVSEEEMERRWMVLQGDVASKMQKSANGTEGQDKESKAGSSWSLPWKSKGKRDGK